MEIKIEHRVVLDVSKEFANTIKDCISNVISPCIQGTVTRTTLNPEYVPDADTLCADGKPSASNTEAPAAETNPASVPTDKPLTTVDVRAAMQAVRNRLEYGQCGAGEAKGPNEDFDPAIHKQLNAAFKEEARRLGYDKPSAMEGGAIPKFIAAIENYQLGENNQVVPF